MHQLISKELLEENIRLSKKEKMGRYGKKWWPFIKNNLIKQYSIQTILDYGCGYATLNEVINNDDNFNYLKITNYDPAREEYSKLPNGKYDLIVCTDVLEHVEVEYIDPVLKNIRELASNIVLFSVSISSGKRWLSDGRKAHVTVRHPNWWKQRFEKNRLIVIRGNAETQKGIKNESDGVDRSRDEYSCVCKIQN